jgi:hypothetical protein
MKHSNTQVKIRHLEPAVFGGPSGLGDPALFGDTMLPLNRRDDGGAKPPAQGAFEPVEGAAETRRGE